MNKLNKFFTGKGLATLCAGLVASGLALLPVQVHAQTINLSDGGSTATVNVGNTGTLGMNSWTVSGQNQLPQQWFYYSLNNGLAQGINTLGGLTYNVTGGNNANITYQNSSLAVNVQFGLSGGGVGSGTASISELLQITNPSLTDTIHLQFYQYSHFKLLQDGTANESYVFNDPSGPGYNLAYQDASTPNGSTGLHETIAAPSADYAEAEFYGGPSDTLTKITTVAGYDLNGDPYAGVGDVTWAFEWVADLGPGQMLDITKDKSLDVSIVPEPSTMGLIALGLGALGFARRRQSA